MKEPTNKLESEEIPTQTQEQINDFLEKGKHELTTETYYTERKIVETTFHFKHTSDEIVLTETEEYPFLKIKYDPDDKEDGKDILYLTSTFLKIISSLIEKHPELLEEK